MGVKWRSREKEGRNRQYKKYNIMYCLNDNTKFTNTCNRKILFRQLVIQSEVKKLIINNSTLTNLSS